MRLFIDLT